MNNSDSPEVSCPLCMEVMDFDDVDFYPCPCRYQICRFCWAKIINEENGLCPACRKPYNSEHPASYKPRTEEEIKNRIRHSKKVCPKKSKTNTDGKEYLSEYRVLQKNLIFVVGLPMRMAEEIELLKGSDYFGKCGKVYKIVINQNQTFPGPQGTSCLSAYVTYHRSEDALRTLIDLKKLEIDGRAVKLSLGTTKYCSQFLRNRKCTKTDCMYLHEMGDQAASFTKEDMASGRHTEYENQLILEFIENIQKVSVASSSPSSISITNSNSTIVNTTNSSSSIVNIIGNKNASNMMSSVVNSSNTGIPSSTSQMSSSPNTNKVISKPIITPIGTDPTDASKLYINPMCMSSDNSNAIINTSMKFEGLSLTNQTSTTQHLDNESANIIYSQAISQQTNNSHHYLPLSIPLNNPSSTLCDNAADIDFDPINISRQGLAELIANESRMQMSDNHSQSIYQSSITQANLPPPGVMLSSSQSISNSNNSNTNIQSNTSRFLSSPPERIAHQMASINLTNGHHTVGGNNGPNNNHSTGLNGSTSNNTPPPGFEFAASSSTSPVDNSITNSHLNSNFEYYSRFIHQNSQPHNLPQLSHHSLQQHHHHQLNPSTNTNNNNSSLSFSHNISSNNPLNFHSSYPDYSNYDNSASTCLINPSHSFHGNSWKSVHSSFCDPTSNNNNSLLIGNQSNINNISPSDLMPQQLASNIRPTVYNRSHSMNEASVPIRNSEWNGFTSFNNPNNANILTSNNSSSINNSGLVSSSTSIMGITNTTDSLSSNMLNNCHN